MFVVYLAFLALITALLALDLGVFHRKAHAMTVVEALWWSALWIGLGLAFTVVVFIGYERLDFGATPDALDGQLNDGREAAIKYLSGYVIEKSLSVDNIFVIATLFSFFAIPAIYQHRVLFWGIFGALVLRGIMIALGCELIARYHWVIYLLGGFLLLTALKMLASSRQLAEADPWGSGVLKLARRWLPVTDQIDGSHLLVPGRSGWALTPLGVALVVIEVSDVAFAVDSIPAVFAVTADPFIVFTSNVFAILGLRSLFFAVQRMIENLRYLKLTLASILAVVGLKMLLAPQLKTVLGDHFALYLLAIVLVILATGITASLLVTSARLGCDRSPCHALREQEATHENPVGL